MSMNEICLGWARRGKVEKSVPVLLKVLCPAGFSDVQNMNKGAGHVDVELLLGCNWNNKNKNERSLNGCK